MGEAEADKAARVGVAEAIAIEEQVRAYGGPKYQVTQQVMNRFADAIAEAKVDVVPRVMIGQGSGGGAGQGGSIAESLLALLLSDKLGEIFLMPTPSPLPRGPTAPSPRPDRTSGSATVEIE